MNVNRSRRRRVLRGLELLIRQRQSGGVRIPQPNPFGNRAYRRSKAGKERIAFILENATLVNDDGSDVEAE